MCEPSRSVAACALAWTCSLVLLVFRLHRRSSRLRLGLRLGLVGSESLVLLLAVGGAGALAALAETCVDL